MTSHEPPPRSSPHRRKGIRLVVDGEAFPYCTAASGWNVEIVKGAWPTVRVGLIAERVVVDADLGASRPVADLPPLPLHIAEALDVARYLEPKE